jgi:SAM-dependent methyltransferase
MPDWQGVLGAVTNESGGILAKRVLRRTPLYPVSVGGYLRTLYFWREVRQLPVHRFKTVLDAGCGSGKHALQLADRYAHLTVVGYDVRAVWKEDNVPNVHFRQHDLLDLQEEDVYDFAYSIDVLEHIPGNRRVISNVYRALRSGGYFYLHMPYDYPGKRILPASGFKSFEEWARDEHVGEQYSLQEMDDLLAQEGFQVLRSQSTFGFVGELAWEIDQLVRGSAILEVILAPLLRSMAHLAVRLPVGDVGNVQALALKP